MERNNVWPTAIIALLVGGLAVATTLAIKKPVPCPEVSSSDRDSVVMLRGKLRSDSTDQARETAKWKWKADSLAAIVQPISEQVDDQIPRSRLLSADDIANRLRTRPPALPRKPQ